MGRLHHLRRQSDRKRRNHQHQLQAVHREPAFNERPLLSQSITPKNERHPGKRVVLSLGNETAEGIPVSLQIGDEGRLPEVAATGWLPVATSLVTAYEKWQRTYQQAFTNGAKSVYRISAPDVQITNVSYKEGLTICHQSEKVLTKRINQWLNSEPFRPVRETLLAYCHPSENIRLLLQTDDLQIQRLPLHQWDWFERYPRAELVLSSATYTQSVTATYERASPLRVLAVLGDSRNLSIEDDLAALKGIPNAMVTCLREPTRSLLTETLYDYPWDIVLFAGHSDCAPESKFRLSVKESLSLSELKYGLRKAIAQNLKLLILNTCDSLSLIKTLGSDLQLPATVVMRSPVPDPVAHTFLRYFLTALSQHQPLPQAVREAREKLQGIEHDFPFSSWIPVLYQTM